MARIYGPVTEEHKGKLRKPRIFSDSVQRAENISKSKIGVPLSEEHKRALRNGWIKKRERGTETSGENNGNWGGGKTERTCPICFKQYYIYKSRLRSGRGKYCSRSCAFKDRVGEKHPHWKGGKTRYCKMQRGTIAFREWREKVFKRDDFTCRYCDATGVYLNAHHIFGYTQYPEARFIEENGMTLCVPCHKVAHGWR